MKISVKNTPGILVTLGFILLLACNKKWQDHNAVTEQDLTINLLEAISENADLSKFHEFLVATGYDKEIASSKTYTIWAPVNQALQSLDPAITGDPVLLKQFIGNHISRQLYFTNAVQSSPLRVPMLNGKHNTFSPGKLDEANLLQSNRYVKNGVLHTIDRSLTPLPNGWELINTTTTGAKQQAFILSLNYDGFDPDLAVQTGVDPVTGEPVYEPGTGLVPRNVFLNQSANLKDEDSLFTYFIMLDSTFDREHDKLKDYFVTPYTDTTDMLTNLHLVRDLAFSGLYTADDLPDTLVSKFGVKMGIDKGKILQTIRLSNGVAYVMSDIDFVKKDKLLPFVIQGENPRSFSHERRSNTFYRIRTNPGTNEEFRDILVQGHSTSQFNIGYRIRNVFSCKYDVYWVAVNDFMATTHSQRILLDSANSTNGIAYTVVPLAEYNPVLVGQVTVTDYKTAMDVFLVAANSTNNSLNPLTLDYIKLVPVIQ